MSPAGPSLADNTALERSDAIEIRNGIIFDFYMGLLHIIAERSEAERGLVIVT